MSAYRAQRTRPGVWHSFAAPVSTAIVSTRTDERPTSLLTAPGPVLNLVFGGPAHGRLTLARIKRTAPAATPAPAPVPSPVPPSSLPSPPPPPSPTPPPSPPPAPTLSPAPPPPAAPTVSPAPPTSQLGPAYCPVDRDRPAVEHPHRIELTIDSLANLLLVEPIPVAIDPTDDGAYSAHAHNFDIRAIGHTVVEALLVLKERIGALYEDLNGRSQLSPEQKVTLQMMHTYIAPKKPEWV